MIKKLISSLLLLSLCVITSVHAKTIIWVAESGRDDDADGVNDAQEWADKLTAAGYTVDFRPGNWAALTAALVTELNAADLVIVSATTQSGTYATDAAEISLWNSVTAPMMLTSPYIARSTRWQWINNGDGTLPSNNGDQGSPLLQAVVPTHPIFYGVALDASNQLAAIDPTLDSGHASFLATNSPGNGTLLAKTVTTTLVQDWCWIVEWKKGVTFYNGSSYTPPNLRIYFTGIGAHEVSGTYPMRGYNLTDNGWKLYLNTVKYMLGERLLPPTMSADPYPSDGQTDVSPSVMTYWTPGTSAQTHDVYLGTRLADVNSAGRTNPLGVLIKQDCDVNTFDPLGTLAYDTTYYWRIDEVNAPANPGIYKGGVWSFTTEPYGYKIEYPSHLIRATASSQSNTLTGPEKTIDGSGITGDQHSTISSQMWLSKKNISPIWIQYEFDQPYRLHEMWVWNQNQISEPDNGVGAMEVMIETSTDGTTWAALEGVPEFAPGPGEDTYVHNTTVDFHGTQAKFVKLTINSNFSGLKQAGLSEVRFFYVPVKAFGPTPVSGTTGVAVDGTLHWRSGRLAVTHDVYLGTDPNVLSKAGTVTDNHFGLASAGIEYDRTYYWKVDEVNGAEVWAGDTWSFSTPDYVLVDDFESYNDNCKRVFYTWADGLGATTADTCGAVTIPGNGSGSTVGNPSAPYAERSLIHGGSQSMPMTYDNASATSFSEATRTFAVPQDWVQGGIKTLVLYFRGAADNSAGQFYVKINNNKVVYNGKANVLTSSLWTQWNVDLTTVGGNLRSVTSLAIGVSGSGRGVVYVDDLRLYRSAPAVVVPVDPGNAGLSAYYMMDGDIKDSSGKGNNGTLVEDPIFVDSQSGFGKALQLDGTNDYVDLPIGSLISSLNSATLASWVNFTTASTGSWVRIFDFGTSVTSGNPLNYMFLSPRQGTTGTMRFAIRQTTSTGESGVNSPMNLPADWHHVAVVINGSTMTLGLYLDGEAVASGTTVVLPKDLGATNQNWLGRSQWSGDGYYQGLIDDFRIYNRAMSAGEVRYLAGDR